MRRMGGQDAAFLYGETPEWHMHVSSLMIVDPSEAAEFSFERLRALTVERMPALPQFRWRVVDVPFGIDRPGWVEEPNFDPDYHIRRVAVRAPGGRDDLNDLVGRIVSYKLDRRKPLWEMWVIEGVDNGRKVAVVHKIHHAIIDGASGAGLAEITLDLDPTPRPAPTEVTEQIETRAPSAPELFVRGLANTLVRTPFRTARYARQSLRQGWVMAPFIRNPNIPQPFDAPSTPFNGDVSARRSLGRARVSLERVKAIKTHTSTKVNDVVLAICAGALRQWLIENDALPDKALVAQVPVSLRTEDTKAQVGNRVGNMFATLATHVEDPAERLDRIAQSTQASKEMRQALSAHQIQGLTDTTPPALIGLAARGFSIARLGRRTAPPVNLVISNVPGPPFPLYMAGARLERMYPMGPLMMGMAMNITVVSYCDALDFGILTCPEAVGDPQHLADMLPNALEALADATGVAA